MMKKLVWPATLSASFALAAACSGGTTGDGEGGQGGTDGSTGGSGTGGTATGGSSPGGQGGLGGGATIVQPETCGDELLNANETDVDCGGPDCNPCGPGDECVAAADCASGICDEVADTCTAPECGDGVTNDDEECDPGRETETCNVDCTFTECGDGYLNEAAEQCEPDADLDIWQRCGPTCVYGVDLDGTWRTSNLPGTNSAWEPLKESLLFAVAPGFVPGLQSFHYVGQDVIYDLSGNAKYDLAENEWTQLVEPLPYPYFGHYWENGAVDSESIWVPRDTAMYRFDMATETWETGTDVVPDGSPLGGSAAVFDGAGFVWYVGFDTNLAEDALVRFEPSSGDYVSYSWSALMPPFTIGQSPRLAYDPVTDVIVIGDANNGTAFLHFNLDTEEFALGGTIPGGTFSFHVCQDRAGGLYVNATDGNFYRYDIGLQSYTPLPPLPAEDDDGSSCVVSEVGYLYYAAANNVPPNFTSGFFRLRLNQR